jgi:hypothetical protein
LSSTAAVEIESRMAGHLTEKGIKKEDEETAQ